MNLLNGRDGDQFSSTDSGVRGYKGRYHLGMVYLRQVRGREAEPALRRVVEECPGFLPAVQALAEIRRVGETHHGRAAHG